MEKNAVQHLVKKLEFKEKQSEADNGLILEKGSKMERWALKTKWFLSAVLSLPPEMITQMQRTDFMTCFNL